MTVKELIKHLQCYSPNLVVGIDGEYGHHRVRDSYILKIKEVVPFSRKSNGSYETRELPLLILQTEMIHEPV